MSIDNGIILQLVILKEAIMCPGCKNNKMTNSLTVYFANTESCYVIIENVPCRKCSQCGEEFFTASVMNRIDEILEGIKNVSGKIFITDYQQAA